MCWLGHLSQFFLFIVPLAPEIWMLIFILFCAWRSSLYKNYIPPLSPPNNVEGCSIRPDNMIPINIVQGEGGWFQLMVVKCPNTFFHDCRFNNWSGPSILFYVHWPSLQSTLYGYIVSKSCIFIIFLIFSMQDFYSLVYTTHSFSCWKLFIAFKTMA